MYLIELSAHLHRQVNTLLHKESIIFPFVSYNESSMHTIACWQQKYGTVYPRSTFHQIQHSMMVHSNSQMPHVIQVALQLSSFLYKDTKPIQKASLLCANFIPMPYLLGPSPHWGFASTCKTFVNSDSTCYSFS